MKYVVILGDGMADYRQQFLDNKTPLMVANKPYIDGLAKNSELGLARTVPCGMKPGSDVANLSVLGYDPHDCYTGRSPLEAASIGIDLKDTDVTARANLVTVSNECEYQDKTMIDYSAGEISTEEARVLIKFLAEKLNDQKYSLYAGISYRHCLVIDNGSLIGDLTPPHDITGKPVKDHLPKSEEGKKLLSLMEKSYELLKDHPINLKRIKEGKNPANSLWFWGDGTKPNLQSFKDKFGLDGGIISAVDLLKGIGKLAKMRVIEVEGATGNYDTNFSGKARACLDNLKDGLDFVYLHMEAPDECGHHGDTKNKIFSIEQIDKLVVEPVVEGLKQSGEDFAVLICPDHPTPLSIMTHCSDPVPYLIYSNKKQVVGENSYDEESAKNTGVFVEEGYKLINKLFEIK
ncbi:MAG: cofactor-independent phosphoglycerate mutase [Clostridiales bacterium]|nr:cofactor-independent phosphoglycerate mutase [Clostridiales bacterium]